MNWLVDRKARARAEQRAQEQVKRAASGDLVEGSAEPREHVTERGIAIIAVSMAIVMIAAMSVEFGTNTNIDSIAAASARDNVRTHFLARSGMNLTNLMIRFQTDALDKMRNRIGDVQFADYSPMFMAVFGGSPDEVEGYSALLGAAQGETIKGLGVSAGEFSVEITTEDAKVNANCANGSETSKKLLEAMVGTLIFFEAFNPVFEQPSGDGWTRNREEQVKAIIDYIDRGAARFGSPGSPEDYGYQNSDDKYEAKDNYIDTVDELRQVRGIDDRFWTLFGKHFTVYGDCKLNLSAIKDVKLIAVIIALAAENKEDPIVRDPKLLWAISTVVAEARNLGMVSFSETTEFQEFVQDPVRGLGAEDISEVQQVASAQPELAPLVAMLQEVKEGVKLKKEDLDAIVTTGPRRTYRVETTAFVGPTSRRFVKRMTGVWDTKLTNQNPRDAASAKGAWVYWKED